MKSAIRSIFLATAVCPLLLFQSANAASKAYAEVTKEFASIGNQYLQRGFALNGKTMRTVSLENKLVGKKFRVDSREFVIRIDQKTELSAEDFRLASRPELTDVPDDGKRLTFHLVHAKLGLEVKLVYEVFAGDFYMRKWLEILLPAEEHLVNTIAVEKFRIEDAPLFLGGPAPGHRDWLMKHSWAQLGQPIYAGNFFLGLEYPASENLFDDSGQITLRHYIGHKIRKQTLQSKKSVISVAPGTPLNRVSDWFYRYVSRIRRAPVRRFILWDSWWTTKNPTEKKALMMIDKVKEEILDKGIPLDAFVLDAHWQEQGWAIKKSAFPNGFALVKKRLDEIGLEMGIWMGFSMGGGGKEWLEERGFANELDGSGKHPCFAAPNWFRHIKHTFLGYVKDYDLACWKCDYTGYGCSGTKHGHLAGLYGLTARTDAMIDILAALHEMKPDFYVYDAFWLSPWWLMHVEVVWPQLCDYNINEACPAYTARDNQITGRDGYMYQRIVKDKYQFPIHSMQTCEPIRTMPPETFRKLPPEAGPSQSPQFVGADDPLDRWTNNIVMHCCRGGSLTELYVSPWLLDDGYGDNLRRVMRWGIENTEVLLPSTRMILGDPRELKVYGYAHFPEGLHRGIIGLRNPAFGTQTASVVLDESVGLAETDARYVFQIIYPYRETLEGTFRYGDVLKRSLQGYETMVLKATAVRCLTEPLLAGARCILVQREPGKVVYDVSGLPGTESKCEVVWKSDRLKIKLDGENRPFGSGSQIALKFPGDKKQLRAEPAHSKEQARELVVDVSEGHANPEMIVLYRGAGAEKLQSKMTNNGQSLKTTSIKPRGGYFVWGGKGWQFVRAPLNVGRNRVSYTLPPDHAAITVDIHISSEAPLVKRRVEVSFEPAGPTTREKASLPVLVEGYERQTIEFSVQTQP